MLNFNEKYENKPPLKYAIYPCGVFVCFELTKTDSKNMKNNKANNYHRKILLSARINVQVPKEDISV